MVQNSLIQVRVTEDIKNDADTLFGDLGLDTPTAIRIFLKQSIEQHGLPFAVKQYTPNAQTIAAIEEAEQINRDPNSKKYHNFSELLQEVQREE
ncbi:ACP phosphodiesterase [Spirochaetia bacterium]|nr:ACP phosphodiesterase [Spirochaetia bacterium]